MKFERLSLSAKLAALHAVLVGTLVLVAAVAWQMLSLGDKATDSLDDLGRAQRSVQHADMLHDALHAAVLEAWMPDAAPSEAREQRLRALAEAGAELRGEVRDLVALTLPADLGARARHAAGAVEAYVQLAERAARGSDRGAAAPPGVLSEFRQQVKSVEQVLAQLTTDLAQAATEARAERVDAARRARWVLLCVAGLAVVLGVSGAAAVGRSIRASLTELHDVARAVADGDLDRRSDRVGNDEVGLLAGAVDGMASTLQQMIERMRDDAERGRFRAELAQALEMADSEDAAAEAASRAMSQISLLHPMELLIADSSEASLERAAVHPSAGAPGCSVDSPFGCVAVRCGHALEFPDSDALNACPHLRNRDDGQVAAVCVPVTFLGRALGVLHVAGPVGRTLSENQRDRVRALGTAYGGRIGTVRAFERTQLQASTDALTGLANRRSVEKRVRELMQRRSAFAFVMADLDHFKRLNDTHGHPAGDEALRLFAQVARSCTRDTDVPGRWGGEEFAFVLTGMDADGALAWTQRLRDGLARAIAQRSGVPFTVSLGVAMSERAGSPEQLVHLADQALYRAKREGRDRAVAGDSVVPLRRESEQRAAVDMRMLAES